GGAQGMEQPQPHETEQAKCQRSSRQLPHTEIPRAGSGRVLHEAVFDESPAKRPGTAHQRGALRGFFHPHVFVADGPESSPGKSQSGQCSGSAGERDLKSERPRTPSERSGGPHREGDEPTCCKESNAARLSGVFFVGAEIT